MKQESENNLYLVTASYGEDNHRNFYVIAQNETSAARTVLNEIRNEYKYQYDHISHLQLLAENQQYSATRTSLLFDDTSFGRLKPKA